MNPGVLFVKDREIKQEIENWIGVLSAMMRAQLQSVVKKKSKDHLFWSCDHRL